MTKLLIAIALLWCSACSNPISPSGVRHMAYYDDPSNPSNYDPTVPSSQTPSPLLVNPVISGTAPRPAGWTGAWPPAQVGGPGGDYTGGQGWTSAPNNPFAQTWTGPGPNPNWIVGSPEYNQYYDTTGGTTSTVPMAVPQTIAPFSGVSYPQFTPPPLPASLQQQFQLPTAADLRANDPGYDARFNQGLIANERSAAAQGSLLSGGTQQALNRYGQDYASNEYNNYVNQQLQARQQQASDYLTLAYGPAWQQNQAAVGQYNNLYGQYSDLIANNRNAQNDYINALLGGMNIGVGAGRSTAPTPISPSTVGTGL